MKTASIIIPTYDRAELLPRAIDSVLQQTTTDIEVIIVDDGSTDETKSLVKNYEDPRVIYLSHEENRGPAAAQNTGIGATEGKYIGFLGSDDELRPTFLERSIDTLESEPDGCAGTFVTLEVYKNGTQIDLHGTVPRVSSPSDLGTSIETEARSGGLLLRASVFTDTGLFDEEITYMNDAAYWVKLLEQYYLVGIDEPLYIYHRHGDHITSEGRDKIESLNRFLAKYQDELSPQYRAQYRFILGRSYARHRELLRAIAEFSRAISTDPSLIREVLLFSSRKAKPGLHHIFTYTKSRVANLTRRSNT